MSSKVQEGDVLWRPSDKVIERANLTKYMQWLDRERGLKFQGYPDLWEWSTTELEAFWESLWHYFGIAHSQPYDQVLSSREMPGARWFTGSRINYAEQVFKAAGDDRPAFKYLSEDQELSEMSWAELREKVSAAAASLRKMGVRAGDRVVAYMPNTPDTLIAFLASASIGAVWSSCSPDFAGRSVIDRFKQIEPKVLLASDGYVYGGKSFNILESVRELTEQLDTLERVVLVPCRDNLAQRGTIDGAMMWDEFIAEPADLWFEQVDFNHPMWVVYSSGTTGKPKGLVHSHGGVMMEYLKFHSFHLDLKPGEVFFWFSTTGWVMWNIVAGSLLVGAVPVLFDGNPAHPDMDTLWRMAVKAEVAVFGTSAAFIGAAMAGGSRPNQVYDLSKIRAVGSTGSPLSAAGFQWVYDHIGQDLVLGSTSGGTDIASGFLGSCPLLPVRAAELQCRCLGVKAEAWDEAGKPMVGKVGELVISEPMPSMPVFLWNDQDNQRYLDSYFGVYPGAWCHGDWVKITEHGGGVIMGRSDSTLNRQGVRMGSSDFYGVLDDMEELADSLIIGYTDPGGEYRMPLFVVPAEGVELDGALKKKLATTLRTTLSPRHVPDDAFAIAEVPRTLNGKKMEVPIIKLLAGVSLKEAVNLDSMANPQSLEYFMEFAKNPPWQA